MSETVALKEITRENIRAVLALRVGPEQARFVPPVGDMIARATLEEAVWYRAVYAGETPVGFIKVWEANAVEPDLWGLLVDREHQGRGYAARAVELAVARIRAHNPRARRLCVGFLAEDGSARGFYEKMGFAVEREEEFDGWTELIAYKDI